MQFRIKDWRRYYDKVQALSKELRQGQVDKEGNLAIKPLNREERLELQCQIQSITDRTNIYLDQCGMRCPPPLWQYNNEDKKTWPSHESFIYGHLLPF